MICVAIGRSRHKHIMAEHRHLAEQGAKMVELRVDYVAGRINIARLMAGRPENCEVIITCRRKEDGGKWNGTEEARQLLLREAIAEGVDYVDIEEDIAANIPRFGKTKRIISYHNFRNTPEDLRKLHTRMCQHDPDIVKLATTANDPHDNLRILELMQESEVPTVAMCMGDIGTPSRILAPKFGSPFTYATFHHERTLAPGQLSFKDMNEIYRYENIGPNTVVFGVIADPIGHSLSPNIHNAAFGEMGIDAVYCPFRVPSDSLDQFMKDATRVGIRGLSVTIPHKEAISRHLSKVDPAVKSIAAVNTVVFDGTQAIGYNTDYNAAMEYGTFVGHNRSQTESSEKQTGAGFGCWWRSPTHCLRHQEPGRLGDDCLPNKEKNRATRRCLRLQGNRLGGSSAGAVRHACQLYTHRYASQRRRIAGS